MKKEFSSSWKSSKQPRKKRKYLANAPLHIKKEFLNVNLSKDLRKKHGRRSLSVRKNDIVKVMRGKFRKKQGKVLKVQVKEQKIFIEGLNIKKSEGSKVNVPFRPSNLQMIEINLDDKKRMESITKKNKDSKTEKGVN